MLAGHRLALALGVVDSTAVLGDDEESRKQLIRAGEAMVNAGLAVVVNRAGTKAPFCTLHAVERKRADQEVRDAAAAVGDPLAHRRTHRCGLAHAITDMKTATRVLTRLSKRGRFNLGIEPRASRLVVVDLDTARQAAEFALRCGQDRPTLTVRSPGAQDRAGNWVHKDGGHIYFEVPDGVELPRNLGVYTHESGWKVMWGECQVLVPPSARAEGAYVLVGSTHPLPGWLLELIRTESSARQHRADEARRRRETSEPSEIDEWSRGVTWSDLLAPDGWNDTGLLDNCGCPIWTAPGDHASLKSATAHEPGCSKYVCDRGHGPLRVWTDNPSDAIAEAVDVYGRTLTKIQVLTHTEGEGRMGRTLDDLGVERPGPTTIHSPFGTWVEDPAPHIGADADQDESVDDEQQDSDTDDVNSDDEPTVFTPEQMFERKVRREYEHELVRRAALDRLQAADAPELRMWKYSEFISAPRPEPLVHKMLYRDSLARIFGAPGGGKSFLALDLAHSVALGRFWGGHRLTAGPVIYVMAEGQAVNGDRAEAWTSKHGVDATQLEDMFITVPDAVMLTEAAAEPFIRRVADIKPVLVVLDTKNAMMVGDENSATDFAVLRRVLDRIRKAADCCVVLVDHTGYEGTRARGSSAGTAAMDTEIRVAMDDDNKPAMVLAEVTRDKAGEAGTTWAFWLMPEHPAAVLVPTDVPENKAAPTVPEWVRAVDIVVPARVSNYKGPGEKAIQALAQMMMFETSLRNDPEQLGMNLSAARQVLKDHERTSVRRAWSTLKSMGYLACTLDEPTELQDASGPHIWSGPSGSPQDQDGDQQ